MGHKFDPSKLQKLDDPARLELFDPRKVLKKFGLREGMTVLDVGTGAGFYLLSFENPVRFMEGIKGVCKPLAHAAIIDWKKEERDKGPPSEEVYSEWKAGLRVGIYAMVVNQRGFIVQ